MLSSLLQEITYDIDFQVVNKINFVNNVQPSEGS